MAIVLMCSRCSQQLEVDDAFANGICRCVHCGALSHVPAQPTQMDRAGRPLTPPQMAAPVVATAAVEEHQIAPTRQFVAEQRRRGLFALIAMVLAVGMLATTIGLIVMMARQSGNGQADGGEAGTLAKPNPMLTAKGPNFIGLEFPSRQVAYLLDADEPDRMLNAFGHACQAVQVSVNTLGDRRFMVAVWPARSGGSGDGGLFDDAASDQAKAAETFPADGLAVADADRDKLAEWLLTPQPGGRRDPVPAVETAVQRGADTIVLICLRDLDEAAAAAVREKSAGKDVLVAYIYSASADAPVPPNLRKLVDSDKRIAAINTYDLEAWSKPANK